jgi:hypothetical protein
MSWRRGVCSDIVKLNEVDEIRNFEGWVCGIGRMREGEGDESEC